MLRPWSLSPLLLLATVVLAQQPTAPPSNASMNANKIPSGWPAGSTVTVFIDGLSFPPGSSAEFAVATGFSNNAAAYGSTVSYNFVNTTQYPTLSAGQAYITTTQFVDPTQYGQNNWTAAYNPTTGLNDTTTATIGLSTSFGNNDAGLTYATSHEDSHDYFLGDCQNCLAGSSIMSYQNDPFNPPFESPTNADINISFGVSGGGSGGGSMPCGGGPCPVKDN